MHEQFAQTLYVKAEPPAVELATSTPSIHQRHIRRSYPQVSCLSLQRAAMIALQALY